MAEAGNNWHETKQNIEHFLPGKHLQSDCWDRPGSYEYIPDSKVFGSETEHDLPTCQFRVKSLIHATTPKAASDIIRKGGLLPNFKVLLGEKALPLIWWGLALEESDIIQYTEQCRRFASRVERDRQASEQQAEVDSLSNQFETLTMEEGMGIFCSSAPFARESRYGNIVFEYPADELFSAYSSQFCANKEPTFRVMGTFAYKQEVMHAVLVCPPNKYRKAFPFVDEDVSIIYKKDGVWIWNPETTGDKMYKSPTSRFYRRWEHATFAFLVQEDQSFSLSNSDMHISYCSAADVFRRHTFKDRTPWTFEKTLDFLHEHKILQPIQLLSMIHKHIVQILRLKVNMQSEDDKIECQACSKYSKIRLSFLQTLLSGESGQNEQASYCPHDLHQMVRKAATQRWELWIREMTHYLPSE